MARVISLGVFAASSVPATVLRGALAIVACIASACGAGEETTPSRSLLQVTAAPRGHMFLENVDVELLSDRPARIYYTTDGTLPTDPGALEYAGPISLGAATLLTFIAVGEDGAWSSPATELYERAPAEVQYSVAVRALSLTTDNIYFSAVQGDARLERSVVLRSIGLQAVTIHRAFIGFNSKGWSFYEPGIFELETQVMENHLLFPGRELPLVVSYQPTETIRSATLVLETDDERVEGGVHVVELWGRIFNW